MNGTGVVGWSDGGLAALQSAIDHPDIVRLAIVATPFPEDLPEQFDLDAVVAKTLLLFGSADPATGHAHGSAWQKAVPDARLEMVPKEGHDLLSPKWGRIMSHLAPRRKRA